MQKLSAKLIICGILSIHFWVLPRQIQARVCLSVWAYMSVCVCVCEWDLSTSLHKIPQSVGRGCRRQQVAGSLGLLLGSTGNHNKAYNTLHYTNANTIAVCLRICICVCLSLCVCVCLLVVLWGRLARCLFASASIMPYVWPYPDSVCLLLRLLLRIVLGLGLNKICLSFGLGLKLLGSAKPQPGRCSPFSSRLVGSL